MPLPNFHACRLRDPGDFQEGSFRTMDRGGVRMILGRLKGEQAMTAQSMRFPTGSYSAEEARAQCEKHGGTFEAASGGE